MHAGFKFSNYSITNGPISNAIIMILRFGTMNVRDAQTSMWMNNNI
jgi:hypothetical protein